MWVAKIFLLYFFQTILLTFTKTKPQEQ
jgi:hypothetical protein